jgi:hypothetical protein
MLTKKFGQARGILSCHQEGHPDWVQAQIEGKPRGMQLVMQSS